IGAKAGELLLTIDLRKRRLIQIRGDHGQRVVELVQCHSLGLAAVAQTDAFGAGHVERVGDAAEAPRRIEGSIPPILAGVGERNQMPGEIAAVDCRYVSRLEGPKISRVVPVEEVTANALHATHRGERRLQTIDRLTGSDPTQLTRANDRKQIEADIG